MSVVDASLFVAQFVRTDVNHVVARRWLGDRAAMRDALHAPSILLAEVAAAVRRQTQSEAEAMEAREGLEVTGFIRFHPVTVSLARAAADVGLSLSIKGCDAVYVALAAELGHALVSFDREQLDRGERLIRVERPA